MYRRVENLRNTAQDLSDYTLTSSFSVASAEQWVQFLINLCFLWAKYIKCGRNGKVFSVHPSPYLIPNSILQMLTKFGKRLEHFIFGAYVSVKTLCMNLKLNFIKFLKTGLSYKSVGSFGKFADSPYYSESELCGGAVTVSFSTYLPWQAMRFLQHTHFSKTCCRPLITSKFLASELTFHDWKSPEIAWGEIWT
jgi:hypothetical protein